MTAGLAVFEINVAKQIVLCIQNFSSKDHTELLHRFDTNLIVVGGTGIAAALSYILDHLEADRKSEPQDSENPTCLVNSSKADVLSDFHGRVGSNPAAQRYYDLCLLHQARYNPKGVRLG